MVLHYTSTRAHHYHTISVLVIPLTQVSHSLGENWDETHLKCPIATLKVNMNFSEGVTKRLTIYRGKLS